MTPWILFALDGTRVTCLPSRLQDFHTRVECEDSHKIDESCVASAGKNTKKKCFLPDTTIVQCTKSKVKPNIIHGQARRQKKNAPKIIAPLKGQPQRHNLSRSINPYLRCSRESMPANGFRCSPWRSPSSNPPRDGMYISHRYQPQQCQPLPLYPILRLREMCLVRAAGEALIPTPAMPTTTSLPYPLPRGNVSCTALLVKYRYQHQHPPTFCLIGEMCPTRHW